MSTEKSIARIKVTATAKFYSEPCQMASATADGTDKSDGMARLNQKELKNLEKREWQLSILAAVFLLVQASGMALLMYPLVFLQFEEANKLTMRIAFAGFCVLTLLFVTYLLDRQRTVRKLKQRLVEEMERNVELHNQANADLLRGLADLDRFHDQLAMDFRRAMSAQQPLTMIAVKVNVSASLTGEKEIADALGEAAKGISRKVRASDAIYSLAHGVFGLLLPEMSIADAKRIEVKIDQELRAIGMPYRFGFEIMTCTYPAQVESAREMEDVVASLLPHKEVWEEVGSFR